MTIITLAAFIWLGHMLGNINGKPFWSFPSRLMSKNFGLLASHKNGSFLCYLWTLNEFEARPLKTQVSTYDKHTRTHENIHIHAYIHMHIYTYTCIPKHTYCYSHISNAHTGKSTPARGLELWTWTRTQMLNKHTHTHTHSHTVHTLYTHITIAEGSYRSKSSRCKLICSTNLIGNQSKINRTIGQTCSTCHGQSAGLCRTVRIIMWFQL